MNLDEMVLALSHERYEVLRRAVELGKWQDGRALGDDERATSLQILIAYDNKFKPEQERIGYIHQVERDHCEHDGEEVHNHPDVIASTRKR